MGKDDARSLNFWTIDEYGEFIKIVPNGTRNYIMYEILFWTGIPFFYAEVFKIWYDIESKFRFSE